MSGINTNFDNYDIIKNYDTCVFTVVHKVIEEYVIPAFISLANQTNQQFDIVCIWESNNNDLLQKLYDIFEKRLFVFPSKDTNIAKNRENGLSLIKIAGYKNIILADADDIFDKNRIEVSLDYLKKYDILINDINLFGNQNIENYLSYRLKNHQTISYNDIIDYNFMGFSNTAFRSNILSNLQFDERLKVIDWFFYSLVLNRGFTAIYSNDTYTQYRIWGKNLLGNNLNEEKIKNIINTKYLHFSLLRDYINNVEKYYNYYSKLYNVINGNDKVKLDNMFDFFIKKYKQKKYHFWLEEVVFDETLESIIN